MADKIVPSGTLVASVVDPRRPIHPRAPGMGFYSEWVSKQCREGSSNIEQGEALHFFLVDENERIVFSAIDYWYSLRMYESLLSTVGLSNIRWCKMEMSPKGRLRCPWREMEDHAGLVVFSAVKD